MNRSDLYTFNRSGQGVRFFLADDEDEEEMTYRTLTYVVRTDLAFSPFEDVTIEEAGSHSDQELWTDVIVPAIVLGQIELAIWGEVQQID